MINLGSTSVSIFSISSSSDSKDIFHGRVILRIGGASSSGNGTSMVVT